MRGDWHDALDSYLTREPPDYPCLICGNGDDGCACPECGVCGTFGCTDHTPCIFHDFSNDTEAAGDHQQYLWYIENKMSIMERLTREEWQYYLRYQELLNFTINREGLIYLLSAAEIRALKAEAERDDALAEAARSEAEEIDSTHDADLRMQEIDRLEAVVKRLTTVPHRCPVCEGRGHLPAGFYTSMTTAADLTSETCRSCSGRGIIGGPR